MFKSHHVLNLSILVLSLFTAMSLGATLPGVLTVGVSDVNSTSAVVQGYVTLNGGAEVTARGICWNMTGDPTLEDSYSVNGTGKGLFNETLVDLDPNTTYYARAYATNEVGTKFGLTKTFSTPAIPVPILITVAQDGTGDVNTIQAAFDMVTRNYGETTTIFVKNGTYYEKPALLSSRVNVILMGEDRDNTIITYDDYSGKITDTGTELGTSTSQTIAIDADNFMAQNITFQNTSEAAQAVAMRIYADRLIFYNCNFLGFQDTYYTWGYGRIYNAWCYIEGTVDFIFGRSITVFDHCIINSKRNSPVTAASTEPDYRFGYVFRDCIFTADEGITAATLGRPWGANAQTVMLNCEMGSHILPQGWLEWSGNDNHLTAFYAEYDCNGVGYQPESRVSWSYQLTPAEANEYTLENIFQKNSGTPSYDDDWLPPLFSDPNDPNALDPNDIDPNEVVSG